MYSQDFFTYSADFFTHSECFGVDSEDFFTYSQTIFSYIKLLISLSFVVAVRFIFRLLDDAASQTPGLFGERRVLT